MRWAVAFLALPLVGCGISAEIARLEESWAKQIDALETRVEDVNASHLAAVAEQERLLAAGVITQERFDSQVDRLREERSQAMQLAVDTAKNDSKASLDTALDNIEESVERTKQTALQAASIGGSIIIPGAPGAVDTVLGVLGGLFGLNTFRNRSRRRELAKVQEEAPTA